MWRVGVLVALSLVFTVVSAGFQYGAPLQRIKRSPYYDCPPFDPHRHWHDWSPPEFGARYGPPEFRRGRYWPPPPPSPPLGPPPGPPPEEFEDQRQGPEESNVKSQALTDQQKPTNNQQPQQKEPCENCDKNQNTAISNAQSANGPAIAIAISGKNSS